MRKIGGKRGDLSPIWSFRIQNAVFKSFIIPHPDVVVGLGKGFHERWGWRRLHRQRHKNNQDHKILLSRLL